MNRAVLLVLLLVLGGLGLAGVFTVNETEYAIRFQLGRIIKVDYEPGLNFKWPAINNIRKFDKRILTLDTEPELMLTSEQKYVNVDTFVKWRIVDVTRFYTSTQGNESIALNRLHGIVSDRIRNQIASRTLVEVVSEQRVTTMKAIAEAANRAAEEFGIEVVDVRIKSIELPDDVRESVSDAWRQTGKKPQTSIVSRVGRQQRGFVPMLTGRSRYYSPKPSVKDRKYGVRATRSQPGLMPRPLGRTRSSTGFTEACKLIVLHLAQAEIRL